MTGNDIVDLECAAKESDWKRKGFMEKIYAPDELRQLGKETDPFVMLWVYWSMKEAAYKIHNRVSGQHFFAPASFNCVIDTIWSDTLLGRVIFQDQVWYTRCILYSNYVHTVSAVTEGELCTVFTAISDRYKEGEDYSDLLPYAGGLMKDDKGLPFISAINGAGMQPVSISHHGRYVAITI